MSSPAFEVFLARLYTDEGLRVQFLASPAGVAKESGLSDEESRAVEAIDRDGLILAAESYARKRSRKSDFNVGRPRGYEEGSCRRGPWRRLRRASLATRHWRTGQT